MVLMNVQVPGGPVVCRELTICVDQAMMHIEVQGEAGPVRVVDLQWKTLHAARRICAEIEGPGTAADAQSKPGQEKPSDAPAESEMDGE